MQEVYPEVEKLLLAGGVGEPASIKSFGFPESGDWRGKVKLYWCLIKSTFLDIPNSEIDAFL